MENNVPHIVRTGVPNEYDHAPLGTLCKVVQLIATDDSWQQEIIWYKQISPLPDKPRWEKIT